MSSPLLKQIGIIVLILCGVGLLSLLAMFVVVNKRLAESLGSQNNLKHLGLAVQNYESTYRKLPAGCIRHNAEPILGWLVSLHPYMEASSWYSSIDQTLPYDHPAAYFRFLRPMYGVQSPRIKEQFTEDGFALIHYMANPNLMSLRPYVKLDEMTSGTSNTWLFGEASGNYQPMAYAYNWRPLTWPLSTGPDSFGVASLSLFVMADGSLHSLDETTDRQVIDQLAAAPPLADPQDTLRPDKKFKVTDRRGMRDRVDYRAESRGLTKGSYGSVVIYAADGRTAEYASIDSVDAFIKSTELDIVAAVKRYPTLVTIELSELDDRAVEQLRKLPQLRTLICSYPSLTEKGWSQLKELKSLKLISVYASEINDRPATGDSTGILRLRDELPEVEIHVRVR